MGYRLCHFVNIELAEKVTILKFLKIQWVLNFFKILLQWLIFAKLYTMYFNFILWNKFYCDSCSKSAAVYFLECLVWPSLFMPHMVGSWVTWVCSNTSWHWEARLLCSVLTSVQRLFCVHAVLSVISVSF